MIGNFYIAADKFESILKATLEKDFRVTPIVDTNVLYCEMDCDREAYDEYEWRLISSNTLANAVTENILNHWEKDIVRNIIYDSYCYLGEEDLNDIAEDTLNRLRADYDKPECLARKMLFENVIHYKLNEFLKENNFLDIKGFITFRLKSYINMLYDAIDDTVEEYLHEKEYLEFIDLLKGITGPHIIKKEEVHVIFNTERRVKLLDEGLMPLNYDYGEELIYDDLLVCILIAISPRKIILHYKSNMTPAVLPILRKVFPARIRECKLQSRP